MTMVDISQVFSGSTFKAADLNGDEPVLTIKHIDVKDFGNDGKKLAIHFVGEEKTLICNKTNARKIGKAFGTNTDAWLGKKIQLYSEEVEYAGKIVEGIRVRTGKQPAPQREPDFDDPIELDKTF